MQKRTPQVDALVLGGMENHDTEEIDHQPQAGNDHQGLAGNSRRLGKTAVGIIQDVGRHAPQNQSVYQGHQNFQAVIAVGFLCGMGSLGVIQGEEA